MVKRRVFLHLYLGVSHADLIPAGITRNDRIGRP